MADDRIAQWDRLYETPERARRNPWVFERPLEWFTRRIEHEGWFQPGRTLDVGTGLGGYASYLAERGFEVLGVDWSENAIARARESHPEHERLRFACADALRLVALGGEFDNVLDVSLFHHVRPEDRAIYAKSVASVLRPEGAYFLSSFRTEVGFLQGREGEINPETGTVTHPLTESEIRDTFGADFEILKIDRVAFGKHAGDVAPRERFAVLFRRRGGEHG